MPRANLRWQETVDRLEIALRKLPISAATRKQRLLDITHDLASNSQNRCDEEQAVQSRRSLPERRVNRSTKTTARGYNLRTVSSGFNHEMPGHINYRQPGELG